MWHAMPSKKDMEKDKIIGKTKDPTDSIEKGETKEEDRMNKRSEDAEETRKRSARGEVIQRNERKENRTMRKTGEKNAKRKTWRDH